MLYGTAPDAAWFTEPAAQTKILVSKLELEEGGLSPSRNVGRTRHAIDFPYGAESRWSRLRLNGGMSK
ncbi:MAG: hypothetical protein C0483_25265 [Pirellula sp.]|nr:hypothetical protein [Pirellula sp.]